MIVYLLSVALACALTAVGIFAYRWDKERARAIERAGVMRVYALKAKADRNPMARIPAGMLVEMYSLDVDVVPEFTAKPGTQHRHPAL